MTSSKSHDDDDKNHNDGSDDDDDHCLLLDWSDRQRRILTANGKATEYYTANRGFPYTDTELPHHHLLQGDTHSVFGDWKKQQQQPQNHSSSSNKASIIVGAWKRCYFYGGWEFSTDQQEECYNLQTHSLFIDLRLPNNRFKRRAAAAAAAAAVVGGLEDLSPYELRLYARQHIFAGYTQQQQQQQQAADQMSTAATAGKIPDKYYPLVCTRHHCIDWNFTGTPRNRPNKWYVEPINPNNDLQNNSWKEWAYATDPHGQHYYCELWERLRDEQQDHNNNNNDRPVIALRRKANNERDGVLIIVGDHFNFCFGRKQAPNQTCSSLTEAVDAAVEKGDLDTARRWLSIEGGHGRISTGWKIDAAVNYWVEGTALWKKEQIDVVPDGDNLTVVWDGRPWEVFESNLDSADGLKALLTSNL